MSAEPKPRCRGVPSRCDLAVEPVIADGDPSVPLAVLIVEHSNTAAERAVGALENAGCRAVRCQRVQDAAEMKAALAQESWDAVLILSGGRARGA